MNEQTLQALQALNDSIKHWQENRDATTPSQVSVGWRSCALCLLFISSNCQGCPVADYLGTTGCEGSPYDDAVDYYNDEIKYNPANDCLNDVWRELCQKEIDFLKSLLPV